MSVVQEGDRSHGRQACWLPINEIWPNPQQPRKEFDDYALMELASSIRQYGLLQPITVRAVEGGYEIVMGERRYRACRMLGFTHMDAFILPSSQEECEILAIIENIQRENLHYFEEAEAYARLMKQGMNQEMLARRLGKSASMVANKLRLLKLDDELRRFLFEQGLTERHARALLSLPDAAGRMRIARQAAQHHLTVKETENLVQRSQKRLPVPSGGRKVINVVRDHRLYLNAIKSVIAQMKESGMEPRMKTEENDHFMDIHILIPKTAQARSRLNRQQADAAFFDLF